MAEQAIGTPSPASATSPGQSPPSLEEVRRKIDEAFEAGNFQELARLSALAGAMMTSLRRDLSQDARYRRTQQNPQGSSPEDLSYADMRNRQLGAAQQLVSTTERASEMADADPEGAEAPGFMARAAPAAAAGGLAAGLADEPYKASKAAAESAKRSISGKAGADVVAAHKATAGAKAAGGDVGRASQAARKAASQPAVQVRAGAEPPPKGSIGAAKKGLRTASAELQGAKGAAGAASRTSVQKGAQAAASKTAAKSFSKIAARAAPKIFGGAAAGLATVAMEPLLAFYQTTQQAGDFLGQIESLSTSSGRPLEPTDLSNTAIDRIGSSPELMDAMLMNGVITRETYAFANPEMAVERGLFSEEETQVGGGPAVVTARAPDVLSPVQADLAASQARHGGVTGRMFADKPTPVLRKKAAENAFQASRPSEAALTDIGAKPEMPEGDIVIGEPDEAAPEEVAPGPRVGLARGGVTPRSLKPREEVRPLEPIPKETATLTIQDDEGNDLTIQLAGAKLAKDKKGKKGGLSKMLKKAFEGLAKGDIGKGTEFTG